MFERRVDGNITLKLLCAEDAEALFALVDSNRMYLRRWLSWVDDVQQKSDIMSFIKKSKEQYASDSGFKAGIWFDSELAGVMGFNSIDWEDKKAEIGYWLGEKYQGNGIITKSCSVLLHYAFEKIGLNKVEIHCAADNIRSQSIPKRLGFVKEGEIRESQWLYDHFVDHVIYGMLAREWKNHTSVTRSF